MILTLRPAAWKRPLAFAAALLMVAMFALAAACGGDDAGSGKPRVVATTVQMGALTRAVAGDVLDVRVLVAPGVDPHDYEASAGDVRKVGDAKLVIRQGVGIDAFLDSALKGSGQKNVVTASEGVTLHRGEGESDKSEDDPHIWHDPENDKVMVTNIARALGAAFPESAATFDANAAAYNAKLDAVDAQIKALIATLPADDRKMVTNHDAFGYFIRRYGLEYVGAVIPSLSSSAESSASQVAALEDTIRREQVKAVFAESSLDPKVARQIASDTGVKIVDNLYGDSLGPAGSGADTIDGMLLMNAQTIVDALR